MSVTARYPLNICEGDKMGDFWMKLRTSFDVIDIRLERVYFDNLEKKLDHIK